MNNNIYIYRLIMLLILAGISASGVAQSTLYFSEYIEGSSYNKALEIYNSGTDVIDLSEYQIAKDINGNSDFSQLLTLSGTINPGETYVIVNANAGEQLKDYADLVTSSLSMNFNGNDQLQLIHNGTVIDNIGVAGNVKFGENVTLIRNRDLNDHVTNEKWTKLPIDYFYNIGEHAYSGNPEIIISEYQEGSGYNKSIEIYNGNESYCSYRDIVIQTDVNGSNNFKNSFYPEKDGCLIINKTLLIRNVRANTEVKGALLTNVRALQFNGNDQVRILYKGREIDRIGHTTPGQNFAKDIVLRRKSGIKTGYPGYRNYNTTQWDTESMDVISGLGTYLTDNRPVEFTEQENYVVTYVPKKPFTALDTDNINVNDVAVAVSYVDGLGRPIQSVNVKASASGNDIVQHAEYDSIGRETHKYLPYVKSVNPGMFDRKAMENQNAYYMSDQVQETTTTPYAVTIFDNTPLNRVDKQGAPGEDWQPVAGNSNDHTVKTVYRTNKMWDALRFEFDQQTGEISCNSYYATDVLTVTEVTDENNKSVTIEYKNFKGQIVLKSSKLSDSEYAQTYYVYDNFGLLRAVITPKAVKNMFSSGWINNIPFSNDIIKELCYYYNYDERKRMIMKQLPGAEPVYMVYDKRDRLVITQDGEQRKNHKWLYTKYDHINRPVQTGVYTADSDLNQQQMRELVEANSNMFEACTNGVYSNNCFPQSNTTLYTETIYDRYYPSLFTDVAFNTNAEVDSYSGTYNTEVKGQVTYTKVRVLDVSENRVNDTWSYTASYYDDKYRNIQSVSKTVIPGGKTFTEITGTNYNFTGRVENTIYTHNLKGKDSIAVKHRNEYDHADRLLRTYQELEGDVVKSEIRYASFEYDELGQMIKKELNGSEINTNYNYNIRGWLKQIENTGSNGDNLFSMNLYYNKANVGSENQYNGNINGIIWRNVDGTQERYAYTYDILNRLTEAKYGGIVYNGYNTNYSYDINGNITTLNRSMIINNSTVGIDVLRYAYINNELSNRLYTVTDAGTTEGFKQGSGNYLYDDNGNMTVDPNKGLSDIKYNNLNLPYSITKGADKIGYIYDVTGRKLANKLSGKTKYYLGNFVYTDDKLDYMICSEGLLNINATTKDSNYEFHLKDHLGNTRVTVNETNDITQTSNYYPFGLTFAQSGSSTNKYLYNGKEKQEETDWLDYGARMYDASLARFTTQDPLLEEFDSWTPYHYVHNNPILLIDSEGMSATHYIDCVTNETIVKTEDDFNGIIVVHGEHREDFIRIIELASDDMINSPAFNTVWREKFGAAVSNNETTALEYYRQLTDEDKAREEFFNNPTGDNLWKLAYTRFFNQFTNLANYNWKSGPKPFNIKPKIKPKIKAKALPAKTKQSTVKKQAKKRKKENAGIKKTNKKRTASAKKWTDIINSGVVNTTKTVSNTSKKKEEKR